MRTFPYCDPKLDTDSKKTRAYNQLKSCMDEVLALSDALGLATAISIFNMEKGKVEEHRTSLNAPGYDNLILKVVQDNKDNSSAQDDNVVQFRENVERQMSSESNCAKSIMTASEMTEANQLSLLRNWANGLQRRNEDSALPHEFKMKAKKVSEPRKKSVNQLNLQELNFLLLAFFKKGLKLYRGLREYLLAIYTESDANGNLLSSNDENGDPFLSEEEVLRINSSEDASHGTYSTTKNVQKIKSILNPDNRSNLSEDTKEKKRRLMDTLNSQRRPKVSGNVIEEDQND